MPKTKQRAQGPELAPAFREKLRGEKAMYTEKEIEAFKPKIKEVCELLGLEFDWPDKWRAFEIYLEKGNIFKPIIRVCFPTYKQTRQIDVTTWAGFKDGYNSLYGTIHINPSRTARAIAQDIKRRAIEPYLERAKKEAQNFVHETQKKQEEARDLAELSRMSGNRGGIGIEKDFNFGKPATLYNLTARRVSRPALALILKILKDDKAN